MLLRDLRSTLCLMQKKSVLFVTGKVCDKLIDNLLFCTDVVAWSESIKYLGIHFYYGCI